MNDFIWNSCIEINKLIANGKKDEAKVKLTELIKYHKDNDIPYTPLFNSLLREAEMYSEIDEMTAHWTDALAKELHENKIL